MIITKSPCMHAVEPYHCDSPRQLFVIKDGSVVIKETLYKRCNPSQCRNYETLNDE